VAAEVEVTGGRLTGGDELVLRGATLYFGRDSVSSCGSTCREGTARVVEEITDPDFDVATTAALVAGVLLVVNRQFGDPARALTEVVRIDRP
jgi:hypothetical protein